MTKTSDDKMKDIKKEIEDLKEKEEKKENGEENGNSDFDKLNDKFLRLASEFDNFKKRTAQEKGEFVKMGEKKVLIKILDFFDNIENGLKNCSKDLLEDNSFKGILLSYETLGKELKKDGLNKIDAKGKEFDVNKMEALMQDPEGKNGAVSQVLQEGYEFNGEVLRHTKVSVGTKK